MIYIISKVITTPSGEVFFNPARGLEVFPTYISALRWLVSTKRFHIELGWKVWAMVPITRTSSGRGELFVLTCHTPFGYTYNLHVSRIPMHGCY
jgi:hypothetical protein